jgi:hypothetical protein
MGSDWQDYQDVQNDRDYNGARSSKEEKAIWDRVLEENNLKLGKYDPDHPKVEWSEHNGDFQKYIQLAAKRGLLPRFTQWLEDPNYMKLLTDKRMFDGEGNRIQQKPLAANFDMKRIEKMLKDYVPSPQAPYNPTVERFMSKQLRPAPKPPAQPLAQIQPASSWADAVAVMKTGQPIARATTPRLDWTTASQRLAVRGIGIGERNVTHESTIP